MKQAHDFCGVTYSLLNSESCSWNECPFSFFLNSVFFNDRNLALQLEQSHRATSDTRPGRIALGGDRRLIRGVFYPGKPLVCLSFPSLNKASTVSKYWIKSGFLYVLGLTLCPPTSMDDFALHSSQTCCVNPKNSGNYTPNQTISNVSRENPPFETLKTCHSQKKAHDSNPMSNQPRSLA